jgi:hypothetical protein
LFVGGLPPGVIRIAHLIFALLPVASFAGPTRSGSPLLPGLLGMLAATLLSATAFLVRHVSTPIGVMGRALSCSAGQMAANKMPIQYECDI